MNLDFISFSSEDEILPIDRNNDIKKPQKIRRHIKKSFPLKRNNYKKYQYAKWKWLDVLKEIDFLKESNHIKIFKTIAIKYNIPQKTLTNKYYKWIKDGKSNDINNENRGNKTYFNIEEEYNLFKYINHLYITNDLFFNDTCLKI